MRRLVAAGLALALPGFGSALAYTPENHEKSVVLGAQHSQSQGGRAIEGMYLDGVIDGVREPDGYMLSHFQMLRQRFEPHSYGAQRSVATIRIASQSFHGSPNPTRPVYTESAGDQAWLARVEARPVEELFPDRYPIDVYAYDTNRAVRNRLLVNASQFLCVAYAHREPSQAGRKLGNLLHMIGDTYSASHVQRSAPTGEPAQCGTEKIEWHFSMDLVSWKQHRPADLEDSDWRFSCLVEHTGTLMGLWASGRDAVRAQAGPEAARLQANAHLGQALNFLCDQVLNAEPAVLDQPAGGAAAGYSSASGTDNWRFLKRLIFGWSEDRAIQPVGLTSAEEAEAFRQEIDAELIEQGGGARFWYPPRDAPDYCSELKRSESIPEPLRCTPQEIRWASEGNERVESLWLPPRQ